MKWLSSSIWQLSLLVFVRIFNESSWKWVIERRQERLIRRVAFLCEAVNLPLLWIKRVQIHTVIKLSVWSNYKIGMCFLHLSGGGGKIEVTVSLIQVGVLPIYDSQDMSVQRKHRLFWFLNQKKMLPFFFTSVEMVRVTQRNMKYFQRVKEDYPSRMCGLLDNTGRATSSLGFCIEPFSVY